MNFAHVHLLLNHFPTVGFAVGLCLFLVSLAAKNNDLKRASLVIFFIIAVLAIPAYVTGNAASDAIQDRPEVSQTLVSLHEDAALVAFALMEITGFFAWLGLWQFRRTSQFPSWNMPVVLVCSILTFGLMARAANFGGEIRHPEIQYAPPIMAAEGTERSGLAASLGSLITEHAWIWPAAEALHFIGLCLLFTAVLLVDLRVLGMARSVSFATMYQLLPLGMLGFGINLITGMMFFVSTPGQYTNNISFQFKILFMVLAGLNVLYFMLFDGAWTTEPGDDAPLSAKIIAAATIILWTGVLFFGHMLPFIGNAF